MGNIHLSQSKRTQDITSTMCLGEYNTWAPGLYTWTPFAAFKNSRATGNSSPLHVKFSMQNAYLHNLVYGKTESCYLELGVEMNVHNY